MSNNQGAPIFDPVIEGNEGKARKSWVLWFQQIFQGDNGTEFSPIATGLGISGPAPTIIGSYYQNQGFTDFEITITPNGGNTTAVAGTTYFDLPFDVKYDTACFAVSGLLGDNPGMIEASSNRCYVPAWSAVTVPLTITGRVLGT